MATNKGLITKIETEIFLAYDQGNIQTFEDFDAFFLEAWNSFGINDGKRRGAILRSIKATNSIMTELRKKAAEAHRPITKESPTEHLPISLRTYFILKRAGFVRVGNIIDFLAEEGERGFFGIRNVGEKIIAEVYSALEWAGIEIIEPSNQDSEALEEEIAAEEEPIRRFKKIEPPAARLIILEPGESFKTGISLCGGCWVKIECNGRSLAVKASRIVIEAEG